MPQGLKDRRYRFHYGVPDTEGHGTDPLPECELGLGDLEPLERRRIASMLKRSESLDDWNTGDWDKALGHPWKVASAKFKPDYSNW